MEAAAARRASYEGGEELRSGAWAPVDLRPSRAGKRERRARGLHSRPAWRRRLPELAGEGNPSLCSSPPGVSHGEKGEYGRRQKGWRRKEGNEPVTFHLAMAWRVISKFLAGRNAVESGVDPTFVLHCRNLLRYENLCRP
jgi:hypothetical protein